MSNSNLQGVPTEHDVADEDVTRRGFVKVAVSALGLGYAAAIGYPIYKYLESPVEAAKAEAAANSIELKGADTLPVGSTMMFIFKGNPSMLIHFADGTWVALSAVCTHLGCTLHYQPPAPLIVCPCHGGQYNPHTGQNVGGPPPKALTKFDVAVQPGKVVISEAQVS